MHGGLVDEHIAYVTSDESFRTPFARGYRVLEHAALPREAAPAGPQAARHRAADHQEARRRRQPRGAAQAALPAGDDEATLVLTRVAGVGTALLVAPF